MTWLRGLLTVLLAVGGWGLVSPPPLHASCVVEGTVTYAEGTNIRDDKCDTSGAKKVTTGGAASSSNGTATAAAPTYIEGSSNPASMDLSGNTRVTLGTLLAGEDLTNNLTMVSGGAARTVTIMTGVTTNTTSATASVYSGAKTPMASVTGTGAQTATVQFYGDMENTTTHGEPLCPAIVLSGTTKAVGFCPQVAKDYPYYHAVTTAVTGTSATVEAVIVVGAAANNRALEWISSTNKTSDALIKTGYGWLRCVIFSANDAAPVSGTISINDAVSAGTGTALMPPQFFSTSPFVAYQLCPEVPFTTGLYFDFTTTSDVTVSASYR